MKARSLSRSSSSRSRRGRSTPCTCRRTPWPPPTRARSVPSCTSEPSQMVCTEPLCVSTFGLLHCSRQIPFWSVMFSCQCLKFVSVVYSSHSPSECRSEASQTRRALGQVGAAQQTQRQRHSLLHLLATAASEQRQTRPEELLSRQ